MWKYVGQRLRDSAEQTCSHLKNLRSTFSTCNVKAVDDCEKNQSFKRHERQDGQVGNIWQSLESTQISEQRRNPSFDIDTPYIIQKCYQKQKQKQHEAFNGWMEFSLWPWTAGFLASVYLGQMVCFYSRRRQNLKRWLHMEQLLTERSLRQLIESRPFYVKSYVPSNDESYWNDRNRIRQFQPMMQIADMDQINMYHYTPLIPVTNDHLQPNQNDVINSCTQTPTNKSNISIAVDDLIATLGSIEFRLGMQNLRANEPETAVSHLKLATTHRHPQATFNLGICFELGIGVEKSTKNAMECYRAAASLGHKKAMYNLGVFYVHGRGGLKKNREAARACFEAADKMGLRQAKVALSLPERSPNKRDEEISWKSNDLIADKISAAHQRRESSFV